jgi:hypothetical protein
VDGLAVYSSFILDRGWLGGWALPQAASYFALRLPAGWWLFGLDLSLTGDVDAAQFRYFARIADERMAPTDAAILVTHEPHWLTRWYSGGEAPPHVGRLVEAHLRGRARLHLAGDIHFYMRHSYVAEPPPPTAAAAAAAAAPPPPPGPPGKGGAKAAAPLPLPPRWPTPAPATAPEHLVVVGTGGAFTHPTHVFTGSTFGPDNPEDDALPAELLVAEATAAAEMAAAAAAGMEPSRRSVSPEPGGSPAPGTPVGGGGAQAAAAAPPLPPPPPRGAYACAAAFPYASDSLTLGTSNLHLFRLNNTRFDVIGGGIYFLLTVSVMPRCASTAAVLEAGSLSAGASAFAAAVAGLRSTLDAAARSAAPDRLARLQQVGGGDRGGMVEEKRGRRGRRPVPTLFLFPFAPSLSRRKPSSAPSSPPRAPS